MSDSFSFNNCDLPESSTNLIKTICSQSYKYDFFTIMRQLEAVPQFADEQFGTTSNPKKEKIRIIQEPLLTFANRNIQSVKITADHVEITLNGFGLFGPSGALPLHFTEYAFQRKYQHGDPTWVSFINMLQHRMSTLFYRAWANAQSITSIDIGKTDRFQNYLSSLNGLSLINTENLHHYNFSYFSGALLKQTRSSTNLQHILSRYFKIPVSIDTNIGYWIKVKSGDLTYLGKSTLYSLGDGLILGNKIFDLRTKFRINIGPIPLNVYRYFFKNQNNAYRLHKWINLFIGEEYKWEVKLILQQDEVPFFSLKHQNQLGLTTWLGSVLNDADDLIISYI